MRAEAVRTLAFGSIVAGYTQVGGKFTKVSRLLALQNFTDADLMLSFDGTVDHIPIRSNSSFILDVTTNKAKDDGFFVEVGTKISVKRIGIPTTGSFYISSIYGK